MKKNILLIAITFFLGYSTLIAQEKYGKTANVGLGLSLYSYSSVPVPAINLNFEFDIAPNITLGPYLSLYHYAYRSTNYVYRSTVVPIGAKGLYYFDWLLDLDDRFDVYAGLSTGFNLSFSRSTGNPGSYSPNHIPFYYSIHAGGEYHFKENLGVYVDLATSISTVGLAFHL